MGSQIAGDVPGTKLHADTQRSLIDHGPDGKKLPRKIDAPYTKHQAFQEVARSEQLVQLVSRCLGTKDVVILTDQLFMKPPQIGSAKPYHQDNFYFGLKDSGAIVTCWVALEDADASNGCLRYINRSHQAGIVPHVNTDPSAPYNLDAEPGAVQACGGGPKMPNECLAEVKQGGVILHHGATLHMSGANTSDRWRRGYAIVYADANRVQFDRADRPLAARAYYKQEWYAKL